MQNSDSGTSPRTAERRKATPRVSANVSKHIDAKTSPRARDPVTDAEIAAADTAPARGLVAMRVLIEGSWDAQVPRLVRLWACTEPTLAAYRRAGQMALAGALDEQGGAILVETQASLRCQAENHERLAAEYRAHGRPTLAAKHDDLQRQATMAFAQLAGLVQTKVSVSLDGDPRFSGMLRAIRAALDDYDRMRVAFVAEVETMTGGSLPAAALPPAREHVTAALRRYEVELGARSPARLGA